MFALMHNKLQRGIFGARFVFFNCLIA
jgi:hypothetical protein